ncbi:MAG: nicotinamide mononucleotide transporter [Clostridia bacterium]|nr:nicotinamide mononucleotide transporter [Clostridia bacterium]
MKKLLSFLHLSPVDLCLWLACVAAIFLSFFLSGNTAYLYLVASLVGATALVFVSNGNVLGQILTVAFSILYGIISYSYRYYGEMITYLGMTMPIAVAAVVTWFRHPFQDKRNEVEVNRLSAREYLFICLGGITIGIAFYFILRALETQNLIISSVSVTTSFIAVWLTMRRSPFYAVAYALNDAVLIVLWALATVNHAGYSCMIVCFCAFLLLDGYGLFRWLAMQKRQST